MRVPAAAATSRAVPPALSAHGGPSGSCAGPSAPRFSEPAVEPSSQTGRRLRGALALFWADLTDPTIWQTAATLSLLSTARSDLLLIHQGRDIDVVLLERSRSAEREP